MSGERTYQLFVGCARHCTGAGLVGPNKPLARQSTALSLTYKTQALPPLSSLVMPWGIEEEPPPMLAMALGA